MAESADKTPSKGAGLEEESDVVELTDEIGLATAAGSQAIPDPESLDSMGLKMPEFKMPGESEPKDGEDPSPPDSAPETQEMSTEELNDVMANDGPDSEEEAVGDSEAPVVEQDGDEPAYDRQAMVKTIQMEAFDRDALAAAGSPAVSEVRDLPEDARFSPDVIVTPPQVLVKKWREGLPGDVEVIVGGAQELVEEQEPLPEAPEVKQEKPEDEPGPSPEDQQEPREDVAVEVSEQAEPREDEEVEEQAVEEEEEASEKDEETSEVVADEAPETLPDLPGEEKEEAAVADEESEESEPIELDDDLVELEDDDVEEATTQGAPPPHKDKPANPAPPPKSMPKEAPKEAPKAKQADTLDAPVSRPDHDDEMRGLVQELMEEEKKQKRKKRRGKLRPRDIWFKEVFNEEYLRTVPANINQITRDDVDFITTSLRLKKKSRILDLACGYGRHSLELAQRDFEVVGLDLSKPLLQRAVEGAKQYSLDIKFIHGDMRQLGFSAMFDGCFIWDTSLGYFDDRTNLAVLQGVHRALKVGGRLLVDVLNRDYAVSDTPTRLWWEGNGCIFLEESEFDYQRSTLEVERSYIYEDGTPPLEHKSFIRLYSVHELRQMLHVAGFKVLEVSGAQHYKGHFLGANSERIIVLAEKRKRRRKSAPGKKSG